MLFHRTVSVVAFSTKLFRSHLKSSVSFARVDQEGIARSIYLLASQNMFHEKNKLLAPSPKLVFTRSIRGQKRMDPPTDFLPFAWERGKKFCYIEGSGDKTRTLDADLKLSKYDVELSELLQGLDDNVRKLFSLETSTRPDLREINKQVLLKKVQQHPLDFDSPEVKIAVRTIRLRAFLEQYYANPYNKKRKQHLIQTIQKRNKMLKKLRAVDLPRFEWLIKQLDIDYTPSKPGFVPLRYTRKNELRRLTEEYCEKMVSEKRAEYHAKLKEQQESFLKEKEEILEWIAKEEKELGISKSDDFPSS